MVQSTSLPLVSIVGGLVFAYWFITKLIALHRERLFIQQHGCQKPPKLPQRDRILGLDFFLHVMSARSHGQSLPLFQSMLTDVGPTFELIMMGEKMIVTNEPANIHAMLVKQFHDFEIGLTRSRGSAQMLGHGILNSDGAVWERGRALLRPSFVKSQVGDFDLFERNFKALANVLPDDGSTFDIQEFLLRFTLDVGTEYFLGENCNMLHPNATEHCKNFAWAFHVGLEGIPTRFRLGKFAMFYRDRRYGKACETVHNYIDPIVRRAAARAQKSREANGPDFDDDADDRYVFLESLIRKDASEVEIRDQMLNVLSAARDTLASLISSSIFEISRSEHIFSKLRREVETLDGRLPTYQEIKDMKYLNYVIKESLRMRPPIPYNARVATKDTCLPSGGGPDGKAPVFVRKGRRVVYQVYSMHRRTDIWGDDAMEFKPERWEAVRPGFGYLPFNGGPRICPGQQLALVEAAYVLVRLLQTYKKIESRDNLPWQEKIALTFSHKDGVLLGLQREA